MNQQVVDRIFLAMLGLLLSACAPAFVRTSSLVGAAVVANSTAIVFSLVLLGLQAFRTWMWYVLAIRRRESFCLRVYGRPMSAEERDRFDGAYWSD